MQTEITLSLPDWVAQFVAQYPVLIPNPVDRMDFVLELTKKNIMEKTGGPFGAAVFEKESGKLIAVGVNRVLAETASSAHAEVIAITFAQKKLQQYDLGSNPEIDYQIVVNAQMCAMCLGAVCWSGITDVLYSASSADVERITGFDEGPLPSDIVQELTLRGITVTEGMLLEKGIETLELYQKVDGFIYNARLGHQGKA